MVGKVTCPQCRTKTEAPIPEGACQFFWECPACGHVLRPKPGNCCVFCSYADRRCPSADHAKTGDPQIGPPFHPVD